MSPFPAQNIKKPKIGEKIPINPPSSRSNMKLLATSFGTVAVAVAAVAVAVAVSPGTRYSTYRITLENSMMIVFVFAL